MKLSPAVCVTACLLLLGGGIAIKRSSQLSSLVTPQPAPPSAGLSEHYELVPGSIYDGDTLRVSDGNRELKVRLCGIDAPEKDQALGTESRDHLRNLVAQGTGRVTLVATATDQYGRTIAEAFIPTGNGEEEIQLNSQMVADGMAYVYPQYVSSCPNGNRMEVAEAEAREQALGVWANPTAQKPWDYRRRS